MRTKINYRCNNCNKVFTSLHQIGNIPDKEIHSECGGNSYRLLTPPTMIDKMDDTVSFAIQKMMHSGTPSGKEKSVL